MSSRYIGGREEGMVSILTVLFFMVFISILVVSFIKIMSDEQRQSTDNDLSSSALAAAQGGIEEGQRIIQHCLDKTPNGYDAKSGGGAACNAIFSSTTSVAPCTVLTGAAGGMNGLRSQLGINDASSGTNDILISTDDGNSSYRQYYTCLTIKDKLDDLKYFINEGKSVIVPLKTTGVPVTLKLTWKTAEGVYDADGASTALTTDAAWKTTSATPKRKPPVLRAQFIPYDPSGAGFDINTVSAESRTMFIYPTNLAPTASGLGADGNRGTAGMQRTSASYPLVQGICTMGGTAGYLCSKEITGLNVSRQYYLRLTLLYGGGKTAELSVSDVKGATGASLQFDRVQFEVDVTGKANDVFRRVQARVAPGAPDTLMPEYALEIASDICKLMITADEANSVYNCP